MPAGSGPGRREQIARARRWRDSWTVSCRFMRAALPSDPKNISSWPTYARLLPHARAALPQAHRAWAPSSTT
ncbi:hypothetical protein OG589_14120 [Sphaerisporangium sp. NBC_01403]|uniref:hypothetical protein n=1 Tax=Sphaerisporangium sp. NBC_01403 TaxID=2903599 RepID=UPI0032511413